MDFIIDREININKFSNACKDLYLLLLSPPLEWVSITPTLHKILAHSAELIQRNGGRGLKRLSEEGIEACNKRLREYRVRLSRKDTQVNNITDCLTRLWISSDPEVAKERNKGRMSCDICGEIGHFRNKCPEKSTTSEEEEINSFFIG